MKNILLTTFSITLFIYSNNVVYSKSYSIEEKKEEQTFYDIDSIYNIQFKKTILLTKDEIIEQKQISFSHQKVNAIFFPELDKNYPYKHYYNDLIIKDGLYYLLINSDYNEDYFLINVENGKLVKQEKDIVLKYDSDGLPYTISDSIRDNSIIVDDYNMRHEYVFITPKIYLPFCQDVKDCWNFTDYDINYFTSIPFLEKTPRSFVMQDTTYDKSEESNEALKIGFYAFSNSLYYPEYSSAKSIVIHNPTTLNHYFENDESNKILAADIISRITKIWRIDQQEKERFLVWFDFEHPFLFMIFDIERGLDIPENHLENIYFIEYKTMRQNFGNFHDPILRAEKLSEWLKNNY